MHAVTFSGPDAGGIARVTEIAAGLREPAGVAFRNGALYVSAVSRILRFDDIERRLSPYCHAGTIADPEFGAKRSCSEFAASAQNLGPHVAALGMRFYTGAQFPAAYRNQVFIAEHGSWNRSKKVGYRVTLVRLDAAGRPVAYEPFAEGWLQGETAWGRPADVVNAPDGSLFVSDDTAGAVYRIRYRGDVQSSCAAVARAVAKGGAMLIGILIAAIVGSVAGFASGARNGVIVGFAVFAAWAIIRQHRLQERRRRHRADAASSYDGSNAADSSGHGPSFGGAGGLAAGAGASGFWDTVFNSSGSGDGGFGGDAGSGGGGAGAGDGAGGGDGGGSGGGGDGGD